MTAGPSSAERGTPGPDELLQMATVASRYYLDEASKVEIAKELGTSRFKVARLLTRARELGIVKVTLTIPQGINHELSLELKRAFKLRQAVVIDCPDEPAAALRGHLGRVAAELLVEIIKENDVLGLAWGRSVNAMSFELHGLPRCSIVQLTGALPEAQVDDNAIELVRRVAELSRGNAYPIYAPLILNDANTARALRGQAQVADAMAWYDRVDVAVIPIGAWKPGHSQLIDSLEEDEAQSLLNDGVRADTSTVLVTDQAQIVTPSLSQRMIGISGAQLRLVPEKLAIAGGAPKADAIGLAIQAGLVTTLVTNSTVARHLLGR